jgi:hypothetical protein
MVQLSAIRFSCVAILWVSLMSFAAITFHVASEQVIPKANIYFVVDSIRKLLFSPVCACLSSWWECLCVCTALFALCAWTWHVTDQECNGAQCLRPATCRWNCAVTSWRYSNCTTSPRHRITWSVHVCRWPPKFGAGLHVAQWTVTGRTNAFNKLHAVSSSSIINKSTVVTSTEYFQMCDACVLTYPCA